jgi:hypothetical protein
MQDMAAIPRQMKFTKEHGNANVRYGIAEAT